MMISYIIYAFLIVAFIFVVSVTIAAVIEFAQTKEKKPVDTKYLTKLRSVKAVYIGQKDGSEQKIYDRDDYISREELVNYCKNFISFDWSRNIAPSSWAEAYEEFIDLIERF